MTTLSWSAGNSLVGSTATAQLAAATAVTAGVLVLSTLAMALTGSGSERDSWGEDEVAASSNSQVFELNLAWCFLFAMCWLRLRRPYTVISHTWQRMLMVS